MLKRYILITALFGSATSYASTPLDSIGVENNNGKKLILHKVDPKESYYSISRKYNVNVKDIQTYNNNIGLQIGGIIKVPTEIPFNQKPVTSNLPNISATTFFEYTVAAKDNLNLIAERFATTVPEIKKLNNLNSSNLQVGQVLKVPFTKNGSNVPTNTTVVATKPQETPIPAVSGNLVTEHTVKPKEYLGVIAKQYGITVEDLKEANGLSANNLSIGQVLKIPAKGVVQPEKITEVIMMPPPPVTNHEVKPKETIFTIAKKYDTTADYLRQLNNLNTNTLKVGQTILVPKTEKTATTKATPATVTTPIAAEPSFEHVVANGETIYSIAQKYQLTTYQLKTYNNLASTELKVGQKLIIKGEKPSMVSTASQNTDDEPADSTETLKNPNLKRPAAVYGLNKIEEKGTGVWISDPDLDQNKMLILHRTAPVGTIIQITNPMTNRSTFAKVVGKFTENETTKDVIIVMTKAVADAVGALDKRFFCNLIYGPKENEK